MMLFFPLIVLFIALLPAAPLYGAEAPQPIRCFPHDRLNDDRDLNTIGITPNGNFVVTAGSNGAILWDTETGKEVRTLGGLPGLIIYESVWDMDISDDGSLILLGQVKEYADLREVQTDRLVQSFGPHDPSVFIEGVPAQAWSVDLSSDKKWALTIGGKPEAFLWDVETGQKVFSFPMMAGDMAISPDLNYVVTGRFLWDLNTKELVRVLNEGLYNTITLDDILNKKSDFVSVITFSKDSRYLLLAGGGKIVIWDLHTMEPRIFPAPFGIGLESADFSPDNRLLAMGWHNEEALIVEMENFRTVGKVNTGATVNTEGVGSLVTFHPSSSQILTNYKDATACLWNLEDIIQSYSNVGNQFENYK